jgi:hypothetical protein
MSTPTVKNKRLYSLLLGIMAILLTSIYTLSSYYILTSFQIKTAIILLSFATIVFAVSLSWLRRTTYIRYYNHSIIVKGAFNKTILTPLKTVHIEPVIRFSRITVLRVNFALDGMQHSYFTFMNYSGFQTIKKRQAISRVL